MFSSDVGHFDVVDMSEVLEEAYELVEDGLLSEADFKSFTFTNTARLHTALNADFFQGHGDRRRGRRTGSERLGPHGWRPPNLDADWAR